MTATVTERSRRRGRPRTDTAWVGVSRSCYRCRRELDLSEFSRGNRSKGPCRDCAGALARDWVARNPERHRRNLRRWKDAHRPPPPPPLACQPGHVIQATPVMGREFCATCRHEQQRQKERDLWRLTQSDPVRLERKRSRDNRYRRRRTERERLSRPPKPDRRQPDGTWRCIACDQAKAVSEFYRIPSTGRPEAAAGRARLPPAGRRGILQPRSTRQQAADGTWPCRGCGGNLPEQAFYRTATGRPRERCKAWHQAAGRARRARRADG